VVLPSRSLRYPCYPDAIKLRPDALGFHAGSDRSFRKQHAPRHNLVERILDNTRFNRPPACRAVR